MKVLQTLDLYLGLLLYALTCLIWSVVALPAYFILPRRLGSAFGRRGIMCGFRLFVWTVQALGIYRLDMRAIATLRQEPALILAPNHPHIIDAILILAYHPNVICVMKAPIINSVLLGAGSRLARFITNTAPRRMIIEAVAALQEGGMLLLFPEGTRTVQNPINPFQHTVGAVSKHAHVPVQTLLIETDSPYLSKNRSPFRWVPLPIHYRVRLGRRFDPPADVRTFTEELEHYFRAELAHAPQASWLPPGPAQAGPTQAVT